MIPVIDRYLLVEVFKVLTVLLIALTLIMISVSFVRVMKDVAIGEIGAEVIFQVVGFQILRYISRLVPALFYFSILYVLGQMYRNSEMTALAASGVGTLRIYRSLLLSALPLSALTAWLSLQLQPWAAGQILDILAEQREQAAEIAGIREGQFNEYSKGELVFYLESIENGSRMNNIFIQDRQHGTVGLVTARGGLHRLDRETGDHYLVLEEGHRYQGNPGQGDYAVGEFDRYTLRLFRREKRVASKRNATASAALMGSERPADLAELQDRLAYPMAVLTLALIAIPLSRSSPRQGFYGRMFFAFLIYFIFLNLQGIAENWLESGVTPSWLGMWWFQVLLLLLSSLMLVPDSRVWRWLRRRLQRHR